MQRRVSGLLTLVLLCACGGKKDDSGATKDDASLAPKVTPLAMPPSGVDRIARMNYVYGDGRSSYDKAVAAHGKKDAAAARTYAEQSIGKDAYHYDAHRLLAELLAQAGEHAAAVDHLVSALSGDYWAYAPTLATDPALTEFFATPHGQSVTALAARIQDDYAKRIANAVWLVGRRSTFKFPKDTGVQRATSRGEVYAYDRESRRYLRLTHTNHRVVAFVRSPDGGEVAVLGFDKIDREKPPSSKPATLAAAWLMVLDTAEWKPAGPKVALGAAQLVEVGYGAGDALIVAVDGAVSTVDKTAGKLAKGGELPLPRIAVALEEARTIRAPEGIEAAWSGDPPVTTSLKVSGGTAIAIPESGATAQSAVALAPGGAKVAFSTYVDPCAKDAFPSLYVADTKKGTLKHLLTAASRFATRWLDATTLAYEDGEGSIRLWDVTTGRESARLENKPGIALDALSLSPAPSCKETPTDVDSDGTADEPLPPEEGSGAASQ